MIQLFQADALEWLSSLPAESVDLCCADPPYESLEKHRAHGTTTRLSHSTASSNDWFRTIPNSSLETLVGQFYRVLKPNRHAYMFCDDETSDLLAPLAVAAGFKNWGRLVWDKRKIGMGYHYRRRHEFILFWEKGKKRLNDLGIPSVLEFPRVRGYPAEKPVELLEVLIRQSTHPGELVLDPFFGSGSCAEACRRQGRNFQGCDISEEAHRYAHEKWGIGDGNAKSGSAGHEVQEQLPLADPVC